MHRATETSLKSMEPNRHGCIIAKKAKVLGRGWNKHKTHPAASQTHSQYIHAELAAIITVNQDDLKGADIFVARLMRNNDWVGPSKPCDHCMKLIHLAGIKRIYYTIRTDEPYGDWKVKRV